MVDDSLSHNLQPREYEKDNLSARDRYSRTSRFAEAVIVAPHAAESAGRTRTFGPGASI